MLLFVNKERAVSSSWLHPTVHVGSLMGSYQQVLHHSARSCEEERILGQPADHCPHGAQTEKRQQQDNWNPLIYLCKNTSYILISKSGDGECDSIATDTQLELKEALQAELKLCLQ